MNWKVLINKDETEAIEIFNFIFVKTYIEPINRFVKDQYIEFLKKSIIIKYPMQELGNYQFIHCEARINDIYENQKKLLLKVSLKIKDSIIKDVKIVDSVLPEQFFQICEKIIGKYTLSMEKKEQ